ncbi:hypothetical protein HPB48_004134 [Haemaphysalis longicornis]|uniref:Uncharacterized protein n=1 Tax=Haemaphysalis longicornis TaxID=44386 RepID=A0A9J6FKN8_HAELO|nr:hypothetical protein HPB48_004134 [Haemaphysalis longicornis]
MVRLEKSHTDRRLRGVLEELANGCNRYLHQAKCQGPTGKTKLDKERLKHCQREIDHVGTMARTMKALVTKNSFKEKLRSTNGLLQKLSDLVDDVRISMCSADSFFTRQSEMFVTNSSSAERIR